MTSSESVHFLLEIIPSRGGKRKQLKDGKIGIYYYVYHSRL